MKSRTRSRKPASIGSNHSSRRPTAISPSEPRTGNFVLSLVMAWSPPAHNAGIVWVSAPGDYATFNSNHTPDGTAQQPSSQLGDGQSTRLRKNSRRSATLPRPKTPGGRNPIRYPYGNDPHPPKDSTVSPTDLDQAPLNR